MVNVFNCSVDMREQWSGDCISRQAGLRVIESIFIDLANLLVAVVCVFHLGIF